MKKYVASPFSFLCTLHPLGLNTLSTLQSPIFPEPVKIFFNSQGPLPMSFSSPPVHNYYTIIIIPRPHISQILYYFAYSSIL